MICSFSCNLFFLLKSFSATDLPPVCAAGTCRGFQMGFWSLGNMHMDNKRQLSSIRRTNTDFLKACDIRGGSLNLFVFNVLMTCVKAAFLFLPCLDFYQYFGDI